jgi:hypothetical protein
VSAARTTSLVANTEPKATCHTCGGTTGFVNNRGTLDVCDDPWHDDHEAKHTLTPLTVETDADGRFILNGHDVVWHSTCVRVLKQRDALTEANKKLREALEYYAVTPSSYGQVARAALKGAA